MNPFLEDFRELADAPMLKGILAFVATWALELVGHPESAALWLFSLMVMDLVLGFARAWSSRCIRGSKLTRGAWKFFRYWMAIAVFVMADMAVGKAFPILGSTVRDTFIAYLAVNEALSCAVHLAFFGMPIPESFLMRLKTYRAAALKGELNTSIYREKHQDNSDGDI